jgi:hypothetical protein
MEEKMSKKKQDMIIVICVITLVLSVCAIFCIYYSNKNDEFIFNEHLDEIVLTVKDDDNAMNISLQEIAYYIINVEGDVDDMAHQFNSENLNAYWNVKLDKGLYTMRKYAKDLVIEKCVMDNIYYMEALKNNVTLSENEKELASEDAYIILRNLTGKQMDMSDYSYDDLHKIMEKLYISSKYVGQLKESGISMEELDYKGKYYLELKDEYSYIIEEKVWDEIKLGALTVDTKKK